MEGNLIKKFKKIDRFSKKKILGIDNKRYIVFREKSINYQYVILIM